MISLQKKPKLPTMHHLLDIESLNKPMIMQLFEQAQYFQKVGMLQDNLLSQLEGRIVVNLFFEPSTRTRHSFEIAAKRLKAIVLTPDMDRLSLLKGESMIDTIHTFEAMGASVFIIRHSDNHKPHFIASELTSRASIINAGDGTHQHPTQALLDLLTIYQNKSSFESLKVAIIGDILHSRVARSFILGLKIMGTKHIRVVAPEVFLPDDIDEWGVESYTQLDEGIKDTDVIMTLRIQKERIKDIDLPSAQEYFAEYGLSAKKLSLAKPDAIVMHPGPVNRGIEIDSSVVDGSQSVILQQVKNGVAMRMAILNSLTE